MADIAHMASQVAASLPLQGYAPARFVGPADAAGGTVVVDGWVLLPGRRTRSKVGNAIDDAATGRWQDLTTTTRTLVLSADGSLWSLDHVRGRSGERGAVSATTRP